MKLRSTIAVIIVMLVALLAGTAVSIKVAVDHLLYESATSAARKWAQYLAENVTDLEQIVGGELPSSQSIMFFQWSRQARLVFRYEIFNQHGYSQLVADRERVTPVDIADFSADAARSVTAGQPIVAVKEGQIPGRPSFYAEAFVPVMANGKAIAVVAAYVDQTEERARVIKTFTLAALALCGLTALAFLIPAGAWHRRTTEKQRADERIRYLAHHDVMTGLANRHWSTEKLQRALISLPAHGGKLALHYVDLDRFKEVNDTLGHDAGDALIQAAAERLRAAARKNDVVARIGGDEFMIVQPDATSKAEAEALAERIVSTLRDPFTIKGHNISVSVSVGVAMAPSDAIDMAQLMRCADLALYKAKADGRNCARFFTSQLDVDHQARRDLEKILREAVAAETFDLQFQPVYDSSTKTLVGFEALLRLPAQSSESQMSPAVFVPVAEELGLICDIGAWVLRRACQEAVTWPEHLSVAVNLSPAQFNDGDVYETVAAALKESGLKPERLELEITEGLLLSDTDAVIEQLENLKALGVAIVMDDFGTGYSSLSYLWRFHFDKVKIDRSFMSALNRSGGNAETIVRTIISLGRSLNMRVTIEGVETTEQAEFAREVASDEAQGYFFGRPIPTSDIPACILTGAKDGMAHPSRAADPERLQKAG